MILFLPSEKSEGFFSEEYAYNRYLSRMFELCTRVRLTTSSTFKLRILKFAIEVIRSHSVHRRGVFMTTGRYEGVAASSEFSEKLDVF